MRSDVVSTKKERFFRILRDAYLGNVSNVRGTDATVKLLKLKNAYYQVFERDLERELSKVCEQYPEFEEELYDKLYNFFSRFFSETGSVFFAKTPYHNGVYEKVYSNEEDVAVFWKTRDLFYVKTERVLKNMDFDYKGFSFRFVVDEAGGERESTDSPTFALERIDGVTVTFRVSYRESDGRSPKELSCELKKGGIDLTEEDVEELLRIYGKQADVDFFIHKRAREFLTEQFDLWLYQYLSSNGTWPVERINQINWLRKIAYKIIDFIAKFEDELLKIWQKPRFVLSSNYVVSLDRIAGRGGWEIVERLLEHPNWEEQVEEWVELGLLKSKSGVLQGGIVEQDLYGKKLRPEYKFLPIDTKYFKDLESNILELFENPDGELDGWLVKSENWQALNTMLPRFAGKVKVIYIDPPYNTGSDEFIYVDKFRRATWLTMLENRISLAKEFLTEDGLMLVSIGDTLRADFRASSTAYLQLLMNEVFGEENYVATLVRKSGTAPRQDVKHIANSHDYVLVYAKDISKLRVNRRAIDGSRYRFEDEYVKERGRFALNQLDRGSIRYSESLDYPIIVEPGELIEVFDGKNFSKVPAPKRIEVYPAGDPKDKTWTFRWSQEKVRWGIENGFIVFRKFGGSFPGREGSDERWKVYFKEYELVDNNGRPKERTNPFDTLITDCPNELGSNELRDLFGDRVFDYPKPVSLIERLLELSTDEDSVVMDFFAGSGTTAHAVLELNRKTGGKRKFVLVEAADHFDSLIVPRIKKLSYSFSWKDGKAEKPDGCGVFVKYYRLEQFDEILERAEFSREYVEGCEPFEVDAKLLAFARIDTQGDRVEYRLDELYEGVDLYETLLCLGLKVPPKVVADEVPIEHMRKLLWW